MIIPSNTFFNLSTDKQDRIITASINEFSKRSFEDAKLSNIIKESMIPRGSFYQYFIDKKDLYLYIFEIIKNKKIEYLKNLLINEQEIPFLELFRLLYAQGIKFSIDHPQYVDIFKVFINTKGPIYKELMGDSGKEAQAYYVGYIESDKAKGIIRKDIDSQILADLVISLTTNIAINEFSEGEINYDNLLKKVDNIISIFKKGIE